MKKNKIEKNNKGRTIAILAVIFVVLLAIGIISGYNKLREIWIEQCVITDFETQVKITDGKLIKSGTVADVFGLKKGANLALINFREKREKLLAMVPAMKSISVSRQLPNKVTITTEERVPIARLEQSGNSRRISGKVIDDEGVVFECMRGTQMLPVIKTAALQSLKPGSHLNGRARAALQLLELSKDIRFQDIPLQVVDINPTDYIKATLNGYITAKIAWKDMDECSNSAKANLDRQFSNLLKAIRLKVGGAVREWNATDTTEAGYIYCDTKEVL
jgi:cell division septal protein FtsQ